VKALNKLIPAAAVVCLAAYLFLFTGNTHEPARYGPSTLSWLVRQWQDPGSKSGHGWLVPVVSIALLWRKRRQLAAAAGQVAWPALGVIAVCLVLYWAGYRSQQPRLNVLCLIGLLWGIPFLLFGRHVAGLILFPCVYLVFAVPMGFLSALTFPLRLISTVVAAWLLNGLGVGVIRTGTAIHSAVPGRYALDVADACSGLQSVIAMSALAAAYAYLTQRGPVRKWLLFLCAMPIAMAGNVARIVTIAVVAETLGLELAMRIYHDFSGYIVFVVAVLLMALLGTLLNRDYAGLLKALPRRSA
jgi:exosortase